MTTTKTCDGPDCGKTMADEGLVGWTQLDEIGIATMTFEHRPGPWHFCSWRCLAAFANARVR